MDRKRPREEGEDGGAGAAGEGGEISLSVEETNKCVQAGPCPTRT